MNADHVDYFPFFSGQLVDSRVQLLQQLGSGKHVVGCREHSGKGVQVIGASGRDRPAVILSTGTAGTIIVSRQVDERMPHLEGCQFQERASVGRTRPLERAIEAEDGAVALRRARRATGIEPRDVTAWLAAGDALLLLHDDEQARLALTTAVRLWRETRQRGAPEARLKEVQAALDEGRLPAPRTGPRREGGDDVPDVDGATGRSQPAARSAPAPRSTPPPRSAPAPRDKPAPAPMPRAQPSPEKPRSLPDLDALE